MGANINLCKVAEMLQPSALQQCVWVPQISKANNNYLFKILLIIVDLFICKYRKIKDLPFSLHSWAQSRTVVNSVTYFCKCNSIN